MHLVMYENVDRILDIIKMFNFFKLTDSINSQQVCGYTIKYTDIQSFPLCQKRPDKHLCLEIDPVDNIDLLTFYKKAVGVTNLERQRSNEPLLKVQPPAFVIDDTIVYIKCGDVEVAKIQCYQVSSKTNKGSCRLKQIDIQGLFDPGLIKEMYISDGVFKCTLNPYLLGELNQSQFDDLCNLYCLLGKERGKSQFPYCEYDLNTDQYNIGLINNLTQQSKTISETNQIMKQIIHRLYKEFELQTLFGAKELFKKNSHIVN